MSEQALAELGQTQVKLEVVNDVVVKVRRDEVGVQLLFQVGG